MIRQFGIRYRRLLSFIALALVLCFSSAPLASAQLGKEGVCKGVGYVASSDGTCKPTDNTGNSRSVETIIKDIVDILSIVVGAAAVIMVIIGGFRYVLSNGDSNNVQAAKNTILYALVGLVVVALAQVMVNFVLKVIIQ